MTLSIRQERWLLFTLAAVHFTNIVDFMIMMPLGPQLQRIMHIGPREFGLIVSSYNIAAGISGFFFAFFIDRFDRKKTLMACYLGFAVGTIACGLAPDHITLVAARVLTGVFGGVLFAQVLAIVSDVVPFERRGVAMGVITAAFSVASVAGLPLGLTLGVHMGWHAPFIVIGILALLLQLLAWRFIPALTGHMLHNTQPISINPIKVFGPVFSTPYPALGLLLNMFIIFSQFILFPYLPTYWVNNVGFKETELQYIYLLCGLGTIVTAPFIGRIADKIGKQKTYAFFGLAAIFPVYIITNLGPSPIGIALIFSTLFFIVISGRMIPATALITGTVEPQLRGRFMSLNGSFQQLMSGLVAYIGGVMLVTDDRGAITNYPMLGYVSIAASIATVFVVFRIKTIAPVFKDSNSPNVAMEPVEAS